MTSCESAWPLICARDCLRAVAHNHALLALAARRGEKIKLGPGRREAFLTQIELDAKVRPTARCLRSQSWLLPLLLSLDASYIRLHWL